MKELITDIKDLPIELQNAIQNGIKNQIEAQILIQKETNPDGLNDYLNAELSGATKSMQTMIQESQKDGAFLETISEIYVWNKERAKKIQEYQKAQNTHPNNDNLPLLSILDRAVSAGFVEYSGNKYKRLKPLTWLAVFADMLNERGFVKDKFGEIETLFGVKYLAQSKDRALGQKNYNNMKSEIEMLFS